MEDSCATHLDPTMESLEFDRPNLGAPHHRTSGNLSRSVRQGSAMPDHRQQYDTRSYAAPRDGPGHSRSTLHSFNQPRIRHEVPRFSTNAISPNAGSVPHEPSMALPYSVDPRLNQHVYRSSDQSSPQAPQVDYADMLNLSEVDATSDISQFTLIPQALALSPDGKLVLLPMGFSPGLQSLSARLGQESNAGQKALSKDESLQNSRSIQNAGVVADSKSVDSIGRKRKRRRPKSTKAAKRENDRVPSYGDVDTSVASNPEFLDEIGMQREEEMLGRNLTMSDLDSDGGGGLSPKYHSKPGVDIDKLHNESENEKQSLPRQSPNWDSTASVPRGKVIERKSPLTEDKKLLRKHDCLKDSNTTVLKINKTSTRKAITNNDRDFVQENKKLSPAAGSKKREKDILDNSGNNVRPKATVKMKPSFSRKQNENHSSPRQSPNRKLNAYSLKDECITNVYKIANSDTEIVVTVDVATDDGEDKKPVLLDIGTMDQQNVARGTSERFSDQTQLVVDKAEEDVSADSFTLSRGDSINSESRLNAESLAAPVNANTSASSRDKQGFEASGITTANGLMETNLGDDDETELEVVSSLDTVDRFPSSERTNVSDTLLAERASLGGLQDAEVVPHLAAAESSKKGSEVNVTHSTLLTNDLSYLLEELENRMGIVSKTEFYRSPAKVLSRDDAEQIKRLESFFVLFILGQSG